MPLVQIITDLATVAEEALFERLSRAARLPVAARERLSVQLRDPGLPVRELVRLGLSLRRATREMGARLIVNDRVDVALLIGADCVHLGRRSMSVEDARALLEERKSMSVEDASSPWEERETMSVEDARSPWEERDPSLSERSERFGRGGRAPRDRGWASPWISTSAHSVEDVLASARAGADAVLLSPIFASPGKGEPLGPRALARAREALSAEGLSLALFALGGIDIQTAPACFEAGADGVAAIRADLTPLLA